MYQAYKRPTRKIAETPILFLKVICRFHMTFCGTINRDRSEELLKQAIAMATFAESKHWPSIHGFQNFVIGWQGNIKRKETMK